MSSFTKRPRDNEDAQEALSDEGALKKVKLTERLPPDNYFEIPDIVSARPPSFEDDDIEENNQRSDSEEEHDGFEDKTAPAADKSRNRNKELLYTARLRAQGIVLDDGEGSEPSSPREQNMDDIFAPAPASRVDTTGCGEEEEEHGEDKDVDLSTYRAQMQEKLHALRARAGAPTQPTPGSGRGILADDEEYQARKQRLLASFEDKTGLTAMRADAEYSEDGRLLSRSEHYADDAWLQQMVHAREATGADDEEEEEEEEGASAGTETGPAKQPDPVADKMAALAARDQQLWQSLAQAQERVDPYPVLRAILRFLRPGESVAAALRRMRPPSGDVKKKRNGQGNSAASEVAAVDASLSAEEQAAKAAAALQRRRAEGEFAMLTDAVNTLMSQGEYGAMSKTHADIVAAIHRVEQQRKLPSTVAQWLPQEAVQWFIRWGGQTEAHGPNTAEQMQEWADAGYFDLHPCLVAPEGSEDWRSPDQFFNK